jgi:serine/threonine protein kinase
LWSVGIVIFVLLVGYPPFLDEDQSQLFLKIRTGEWSFSDEDWKHISEDAKELIRGLLTNV